MAQRPKAYAAILAAFGVKHGESPVGEGQKIILLPEEPAVRGEKPGIARISVYADDQLKATVAITDGGGYKPVTLRAAEAPRKPKATDEEGAGGGMSLYQSLYETALKQGAAAIDHRRDDEGLRQRCRFPARDGAGRFASRRSYSDPDDINPRPELLCASMTVRDQTFKYYRFQTPDDNMVDFYDENGRSMRKFLVRKPIAEGDMTSPFGMRFHPILHYARMHTGVDWAAPIGTPIYAAGNGVIIKAGWDGGYGRRVEIQHANGYVTAYNHMSGFGRGIVEGAHVVQGQTVGYLGDSGLATGPHLHYEVIINGNFVDPMAIKLARTREFDGKMLGAFKRERDRIDQLMGESPSAVAMAAARSPRPPRPRSFNRTRPRVRRPRRRRTPTPRELRPGPSLSRAVRQATRTDGFSTISLRRGRERAGDADSAARAGEKRLQQPVDRGRGKQVASAHDVGHALQRIVDHHRQMVARRQIAAAEDNVAPNLRRRRALGRNAAFAIFDPGEIRRRGVDRAAHVEAESRPVAAREAVARFGRRERAAGSRIERRAVRVATAGGGARDLRAAAKAGVDEAPPVEAGERRRVVVAMLALPAPGAGKRSPSQARSSTMAASNCGLQRPLSKSSMRRIRRPPVSAARRSFMSAE